MKAIHIRAAYWRGFTLALVLGMATGFSIGINEYPECLIPAEMTEPQQEEPAGYKIREIPDLLLDDGDEFTFRV